MLTLQRYGLTASATYGQIDNLTMTYTGNQMKTVNDAAADIALNTSMDFKNYSNVATEYTYNRNGAMSQDLNKGISSISYNSLNLPRMVDIKNKTTEGRNEYTYSASGQKLKAVQKWNPNYSTAPVIGSTINTAALTQSQTTDYVGNIIYENNTLKRILVDGGYNESGNYYFYINDHLGNNRIVTDAAASVVQSTQYYPFGTSFADASGTSTQPYKYNGKELDARNGLNMYDYSARWKDDFRFTTVDPLAEKYYSISPYAYVMNNPLKYIDPDGCSTWVMQNSDGTYRVVGGDLDDDDLNIYVYNIKDGNFVRGESIGESDLISSFFYSDANDGKGTWAIGSIINPSDNSGKSFFDSFNNEEPAMTNYMENATGGEKYDFKRAGTTLGDKNYDNYIYHYRGMPIGTRNGKTVYSSARDIGNYTAGYIAGHHQIRWDWARKQFDKLESLQKGYPTVEGYSTQNAQFNGWNAGLKSSYENTWKTIRWTAKSIPGGIKWLFK